MDIELDDLIHKAVANLTAVYPTLPIVITGHSLGAALATLAAIDLTEVCMYYSFLFFSSLLSIFYSILFYSLLTFIFYIFFWLD